MIDLNDIRSLSEFQRNSKSHIQRLRKTGKPSVLTVNGRAEVVVQDVASYQKLLEAAAHAESVEAVRVGLEQMRRGEGEDFKSAALRLREKHFGPDAAAASGSKQRRKGRSA